MEDDEYNVKRRTDTQEKREKRRRVNRIYQIMAILFVVCLAAAVIANLIKKDVEFSESENRMLTERPKLIYRTWPAVSICLSLSLTSLTSLFEGLLDSIKLNLDKLTGKKESNGVYLGKDGFLMEKLDEPNTEYEERI